MLAQQGQPQEDGLCLAWDGELPGAERPEGPGGWASCGAAGPGPPGATQRLRGVAGAKSIVTLRDDGGHGQKFAGGYAASEDKEDGWGGRLNFGKGAPFGPCEKSV